MGEVGVCAREGEGVVAEMGDCSHGADQVSVNSGTWETDFSVLERGAANMQ